LVDKIKKLANKYPQYIYATVERKDVPAITGRLMVLVAPIVLVFVDGKEVYRADRYVRMNELERVLHQYDSYKCNND
jgi:thioredoxin-like negative regulator of GroEL